MERDALIERLGAAVREIPGVRLAYLFGSQATGRARPDSDVDLALLIDDDLPDGRWQTMLRTAPDAIDAHGLSSDVVQVTILNGAPPLLRHRVIRDGVLLFERSPEERVRFVTATLREYQDGVRWREEFTRRLVQRILEKRGNGGSRGLLEKARSVGRLFEQGQGVSRDDAG